MLMTTGTIDMQKMRYLNLFAKITRIDTRHVFYYNDMLVFCVPKQFLKKALGNNNENLMKISRIVKKRIRIIPTPQGVQHVKDFIKAIVSPIEFAEVEIKDNEIIVTGGSRSTNAMLIGRDKKRLIEMQKIIKDFFGKDFRVA